MNSKNIFLGLLLTLTLLQAQEPQKDSDIVSVIGVGDVMLGTNFPSKNYLPANGGKDLLRDVNADLRDADLTFANLEGTILNSGKSIKGSGKNVYAFRMPEYLVKHLNTAGIDMVSVANNHVRDFGTKGMKNTMKVLKKHKIAYAGLRDYQKTTVVTRNGVKYGLAAFAPNVGTVSINNTKQAKKIVAALAKKCDIVIVSFHGGAEGRSHQHVPRKKEYFHRENRSDVHAFSHAVIDAGADIVFGHGPHVTRAVEVYKDRFIAYSLGNFCTYGRFNLRGVNGVAPLMKVFVNKKDGSFVNAKITAIKQAGGRVQKDSKRKVITLIQELTKADGFNDNIIIYNDGRINKK